MNNENKLKLDEIIFQDKFVAFLNQEIKKINEKLSSFNLNVNQEDFDTIRNFFIATKEIAKIYELLQLSHMADEIEISIETMEVEGLGIPENILKIIRSMSALEQYIDNYIKIWKSVPERTRVIETFC